MLCCAALSLLLLAQKGKPINQDRSESGPIFGAGWTADSLSNIEIGRFPGRTVSYRFRALHSGRVNSILVYFIFRTLCDGCYANGNGGRVMIQLVEDDGSAKHFPGDKVLASALVDDPLRQWNRLVTFDTAARIEVGKLYHIVFSNNSPTARQNYVSIDDLYARSEDGEIQPSAQTSELTVLLKGSSTTQWEVKRQLIPVFALNLDDSYRLGQGYIDVMPGAVNVSDGQSARESFVFPGPDQPFRRVAVRFQPVTSKGRIELQVIDAEEHVLASRQFVLDAAAGAPIWETLEFKSPLVLKGLRRYSVTLRAREGAAFKITPLQKGARYGFDVEGLFKEGHCEVKLATGWASCLRRPDLDIPFYFQ